MKPHKCFFKTAIKRTRQEASDASAATIPSIPIGTDGKVKTNVPAKLMALVRNKRRKQ